MGSPLLRALPLPALLLLTPSEALSYGESVNGFPSYTERAFHQWVNRARADPQAELTCGDKCLDAPCYGPMEPFYYSPKLNRAARFHADSHVKANFPGLSHSSFCTLRADIGTTYPAQCDASAACACEGGTFTCGPSGCTNSQDRVLLFQVSPGGEVINSTTSPKLGISTFLNEPWPTAECGYHQSDPATKQTNGHRFNLLATGGSIGWGTNKVAVGDVGFENITHPLASGAHYPQSGETVEFSTSWHADAAPAKTLVNVDGACKPLQLERGKPESGTYRAELPAMSGCHRYYFVFLDASGKVVTLPETGSLGVGAPPACPEFDAARPPLGAGCDVPGQGQGGQGGQAGSSGQAGGAGAAGSATCVCTNGFDVENKPIDPSTTYCGQVVCGNTKMTYRCTPAGWTLDGVPCGQAGAGGAGAQGGSAGAAGASAGKGGSAQAGSSQGGSPQAGKGGSAQAGGAGGKGGAGQAGSAGKLAANADEGDGDSGCGCRLAGPPRGAHAAGLLALAALALRRRRRGAGPRG